jgi:hypothetical protein
MAQRRPDLLERSYQPFPVDRLAQRFPETRRLMLEDIEALGVLAD